MKTRYIRRYGLLLMLSCWLTGCTDEQEDYISKYCPGSCTEVNGKVMRSNGQPVANVQLSATWRNQVYLSGGIIRKKAVAYTDAQGNYSLRFLLRDDEMQYGLIEIVPSGAICGQSQCPSYNLYWPREAARRDTTFTNDFVID